MTYSRRSSVVCGFVNFPILSTEYTNTKEGGMFVELCVISDNSWMVCCGGDNIKTTYTETLVGTDSGVNSDNSDEMYRDPTISQRFSMEESLFPNMPRSYDSIPMLACVTMGSTGWSGYSESNGLWRCCYDDLTSDGKNLYDTMKKLYGESCRYHLITWLDT